MKTSISTYSFGKYNDILGIDGVIEKAAEIGFEAIEFVDGPWTNDLDPAVAAACRKKAESLGLELSAYCTGNDFLDTANETFEDKISRLKKHVDFAALLGVKGMRHDVSYSAPGRSYDAVLPILAEGCRQVAEYAKGKGIFTMTENHGWFSQDSDRVEKLYNAVNHENFGLLVDIGNFMCADEEPKRAVGITAKYARHVHCKDFIFKKGTEMNPGNGWFETRGGDYIRGTILGHGVVPVPQCLRVLQKYGYDGYVTIEFEGVEDNLLGIAWSLDFLKRCLGK
ncbi:MAG: sugar phosphate isomerase/epimerase [Clostridia bacterium]|nr:sugar phosphate isomerase/epimerase [Clostridia bacterium]